MTCTETTTPAVDHRIGMDFLLAGDATFTVEVPEEYQAKCGLKPWYTFRIELTEASDRWPEAWFVKLLVGPENTRDYEYVGKLDRFTGQVNPTAKSKLKADSPPVRLLNRILARVWSKDHHSYRQFGFRLLHVGKCGRCGRRLTVPSSIETGIGPECATKLRSW